MKQQYEEARNNNCGLKMLLIQCFTFTEREIFETIVALGVDKGLEAVQIAEHGVKFQDKTEHDIGK